MADSKSHSNGKGKRHEVAVKGGKGGRSPAPGSRLAEAFEAVERFPVLVESRERVMGAATAETARVGEVVETFGSDVPRSLAVMRFPNRAAGNASGGIGSLPAALDVLKPSGVVAL